MSPPTASAKKRPSVAMPMATNQGAAASSIRGTPQSGRSARNQGAAPPAGTAGGTPGQQRPPRPDRPLQQHAGAEQQPERRRLPRGKGARPHIGGAEQPHG